MSDEFSIQRIDSRQSDVTAALQSLLQKLSPTGHVVSIMFVDIVGFSLTTKKLTASDTFLQLKALLEPFGITRYYTDGWGAYDRHIEAEQHTVGKENTQKIESKHTTLRTRIKRLVRRTICFSKTERMHDLVIGLFINRYEFGRAL